ncbi:uncharacterized protein LOC133200646 [Saccostrea echinata]|uniref:uncharacterized protein LOC133200646 n=1 Tax=Saccostrea echinata TaxID=191078 RepID=UPI002A805B65|nr:uncharacterized protein LOC133200646 [Saccostrea echinata]
MLYLKPSDIRYSQDSIGSHFGKGTIHSYKRIGETLDDLLLKRTTLDQIPTITVSQLNGLTFTSDNRRLWVFKKLEELGECEEIEVRFGYIQPSKFTTNSSGISIRVRGDPGGCVWRTWNSARMSATPSSNEGNGSLRYRLDMLRREGIQSRYEQRYEEALFSLGNAQFGPSSMVAQTPVIKLTPKDVGFYQMRSVSYGQTLGERLDKCLLKTSANFLCSLDVFQNNSRYYTSDCDRLWLSRTLEKFGKKVEIKGTIKSKPSDPVVDLSLLSSLSDSLKISTPIGGEHWKKIENILDLPTLERKKVLVSNIYFTVPAISDVYGEDSIAKVLVHSFATTEIPRSMRVIEHNGNFYALDNEILWVLKEIEKILGRLQVIVEVKMQMDRVLLSNFTSDKIEKVDISVTSDRHTNEENFIIQYIKNVSM